MRASGLGAAGMRRIGFGDVARRLAVRCVARIFEVYASCGDLAPEPRARWVAQSSEEEKT